MKKTLFLILGCVFSLALFAVTLEGLCSFLIKMKVKTPTKASSQREIILFERVGKWKSVNPPNITQWTFNDSLRDEHSIYTDVGLKHGKSLWNDDGMLAPGIDDEFRLLGQESRREKWRTRYRTNSFGRRVTLHENRPSAHFNIVFEGCSFTFGEGVPDNKTYPSRVGSYISNARVFNHGIQGSSPAKVLRDIQRKGSEYFKDVDDGPGFVVFTFIDDHVKRVIGSSTRHNIHPFTMKSDPYYALEGDKLVFKGGFADHAWKKFHLFKFLGRTSFARYFWLDFPLVGESGMETLTRVFVEIKNEIHRHRPALKFVVAIYPGEDRYGPLLVTQLSREGIETLDYSPVSMESILGPLRDLGNDRHPSPMAYDLFAFIMSEDLKSLSTATLAKKNI